MIDVFGLAGSLTGEVNPQINATVRISTGSTENPDGSPCIQYDTADIVIEVQALTSQELQQIQNINQQADNRAVYVRGAAKALNRPLQANGDILTFYGSDWLVIQQLEEWGCGEWSKVAVTRQTPSM